MTAPAPSPRALLRALFDAAVASAQPSIAVPPHLPDPASVRGRLIVIGAGKASAAMAQAVERHWTGPLGGLVGFQSSRSPSRFSGSPAAPGKQKLVNCS